MVDEIAENDIEKPQMSHFIRVIAISYAAVILSIAARICYDMTDIVWLRILPSILIAISIILNILFADLSKEKKQHRNKRRKTILLISINMPVMLGVVVMIFIFILL